ncbi:hypothetical protein F406_gp125 [Agrobacterium phage 7-7-1]|uniref:Uncharacterized protein n=1 Tax=Agrobacterium phage 7-7-1 TaxID=1161931 RepID=J7FAS5_9CAUD|nr:hypothetical protein F406_gp125 [Agrobacterium phage 7-7-1]AFH19823.1 hypothetical protein 7-7-1_000125 [Agrobacterium phage 7-7-1]
MAKLISVTGVEGRIAYSAPVGGSIIPVGKSVDLPDSKWLQSRLSVGDIAIGKPAKAPRKPADQTELKD